MRSPESVQRLREINYGLACALGADTSVHDPARVLGLVGTLNTKYTPPRPVRVLISQPANKYPIAAFDVFRRPLPATTATTTKDPLPAPESFNLDSLDVSLASLIREGAQPDIATGKLDRSRADFAAVCGLLKGKRTKGEIVWALTNPEHKISEKYLERGPDGDRYLVMTVAKAEKALEEEVALSPAEAFANEKAATKVQARSPLEFEWASDVKMRRTEWLWDSRIAVGELNIVAGLPGQGKSTLTYWLAAEITQGRLPGDLVGTPRNVIIASAEDRLETVIAPRLRAADADMRRVRIITRGKTELLKYLELLEKEIVRLDACFLVLDPVNAFLSGGIDSFKDADIRRVLAPLAELADKRNVAILLVMHFNKDSRGEIGDVFARIGGSIAYTGAARSVFIVVSDPEDPKGSEGTKRILGHSKSNSGLRQSARRFETVAAEVEQPNEDATAVRVPTSKLLWGAETNMTHEELLRPMIEESATREEQCRDWIREFLKAGERATENIVSGATDAGFRPRTIRRAKESLHLAYTIKPGKKGARIWFASLPSPNEPRLEDLDGRVP